ncbi:MAG: hypothetical protein L3J82_03360 [Planctomycetes bacterium]|nr:hypothetical protein [Planctomycetota bacterium]
MRFLLLTMLLLVPALGAQSQRDAAREITSRPEYRDYKIEDGEKSREDFDAESGRTGGRDDGRDKTESGTRRRADSRETVRRDSGEESSWGGGGSPFGAGVGQVFVVIMWGVFGAGILVAIFFIVRAIVGMKRSKKRTKSKKAETKKASASEEALVDEPDVPAELMPVFRDALQQALEEYQKALTDKNWARATLLSYRIFWLKAGWQGFVLDEDVRTWRDAIRMVQTRDHRQSVKALLRLVESVRYGKIEPSETEFRDWHRELETLPTRGILA